MSVLLTLLLSAAPNPFLAEALEHERNLDFERCVERLEQAATQWKSTPQELREIELHAGLCTFNQGQKKTAAEHFRTALRIDEGAELPPYTSPKAIELFFEVKRALRAPPPPMPQNDLRDGDLPNDAPHQAKLEPPAPAWRLGPFLTKRAAPLALSVVTIASFITALSLGLGAQRLATQANAAQFESDFHRLGDSARGQAIGATLAWIISGLAAIGTGVAWWVTCEPSQSSGAEAQSP